MTPLGSLTILDDVPIMLAVGITDTGFIHFFKFFRTCFNSASTAIISDISTSAWGLEKSSAADW